MCRTFSRLPAPAGYASHISALLYMFCRVRGGPDLANVSVLNADTTLLLLQRCRDIIQDGRLALVVSRRGRSSRSTYRHVYETLQAAVDDSR